MIWPQNEVYYPGLSRDNVGYIYWRGQQVEHYSFHDDAKERDKLTQLWNCCMYLESLGITVTASHLAFWSWFNIDQKNADFKHYLPLLKTLPGLWVRPTAITPLSNVPGGKHRIDDEGDELLVSTKKNQHVIWNRATKTVRTYSPPEPLPGELDIYYYPLEREGWRTPNMDGITPESGNGIMFATAEGVLSLLKRFDVPIWIRHIRTEVI